MAKLLNVLGSEKAFCMFLSFCLGILFVTAIFWYGNVHVLDDLEYRNYTTYLQNKSVVDSLLNLEQ